jgi:hypothetical protein
VPIDTNVAVEFAAVLVRAEIAERVVSLLNGVNGPKKFESGDEPLAFDARTFT